MSEIVVSKDAKALSRTIFDGLTEHGLPFIGKQKIIDLAFEIEHESQTIGGVVGEVWNKTLIIHQLWIALHMRNAGLGRQLVTTVEQSAHKLGAIQSCVNTMSYEAPDFYRKLGYSEFGRVFFPEDHVRIWLSKSL